MLNHGDGQGCLLGRYVALRSKSRNSDLEHWGPAGATRGEQLVEAHRPRDVHMDGATRQEMDDDANVRVREASDRAEHERPNSRASSGKKMC